MTRYLFQYILVCFEGFVLWTLNVGSENIKEGLQGIKHHIWSLNVSSENFLIIDENNLSEAQAQNRLISLLDEFKGFYANGYATLGKPLLSSIFANFITYVIILIQFRISVNPVTTPTSE